MCFDVSRSDLLRLLRAVAVLLLVAGIAGWVFLPKSDPLSLVGALTVVVFAVGPLCYLAFLGLSRLFAGGSDDGFDAGREATVALVGGIVGSIAFATVSPFVIPPIQHAEGQYLADEPDVDISVSKWSNENARPNAEDVGIDLQDNQTFYTVHVENTGHRQINNVELKLNFERCVVASGVASFQDSTTKLTQWTAFLGDALRNDDNEQCTAFVYTESLSEDVRLYFITERRSNVSRLMFIPLMEASERRAVYELKYQWKFAGQTLQEVRNGTVEIENR